MPDFLVLGSGLVVGPLVRHLLERDDQRVTLANRTLERAAAVLRGHPRGTPVAVDVADAAAVAPLIARADVVLSMVPYVHHVAIAKVALAHGKPMVTTSYVSPAMRALDADAKRAGVPIVNEVGLDPGIDHMSAMRVIDRVRAAGGRVAGFTSWCGGLPAPEANDNPWGYKFSWSPRGVVLAARNPARFRRDGRDIDVPGEHLFEHVETVAVEGHGTFEGYPNRNSMDYVETYGLTEWAPRTMFRGTLRWPGWAATWHAIKRAGWLDETPVDLHGKTLGDVFGTRAALAARLGLAEPSDVLDRLEWLGLFSGEPVPPHSPSLLDALAHRLEKKLVYKDGERDMVVMQHVFECEYGDRKERVTATLVEFGIPGGDSAMARAVGIPAALAAEAILRGTIRTPGVLVPVMREIYDPILDDLERRGIRFVERVTPA